MTQDEQIFRQKRIAAAVGVAAGGLSAVLGIVVLLRDGQRVLLISAVTGVLTAFYLARRYHTLTEQIELEQNKS